MCCEASNAAVIVEALDPRISRFYLGGFDFRYTNRDLC
jgi:hypothetical protein